MYFMAAALMAGNTSLTFTRSGVADLGASVVTVVGVAMNHETAKAKNAGIIVHLSGVRMESVKTHPYASKSGARRVAGGGKPLSFHCGTHRFVVGPRHGTARARRRVRPQGINAQASVSTRYVRPVKALVYGTAWKEDDTARLVGLALRAGLRAFDTANQRKHYFEAAVGDAIAEAVAAGVVRRESLWLQTKFTHVGGQDRRLPYDPRASVTLQVRESFDSSLLHLGVKVLDSYLLHGPSVARGFAPEDWEAWAAMEAPARRGSREGDRRQQQRDPRAAARACWRAQKKYRRRSCRTAATPAEAARTRTSGPRAAAHGMRVPGLLAAHGEPQAARAGEASEPSPRDTA